MEQKPILYTYGNIQIKATELIQLLQAHSINCVVDCRPFVSSSTAIYTSTKGLENLLEINHIIYLHFFKHFGFFPNEVRNKRGEPVYKKVIQTESFLQGIERINIDIEKGYNICIIDEQAETHKSKRFTLIGKYLKEKYHILHIQSKGNCYSQEQVEEKIEKNKTIRKQKANEAQLLGQTGEELAALYLTHNGYQILDHNWNLHRGCELDLVAIKDNKLHFIEVKTRTSDKYGEPQTAINYKKMRNISKAIRTYQYRRNLFNIEYFVDSIAIIYRSDNDYDLKHFIGIRMDGGACYDVHTFNQRP